MNDKVIIVATRQVKIWQLPAHKNIVMYEGGETRSAHLTLTSRGGQAIERHLGLTNLKGAQHSVQQLSWMSRQLLCFMPLEKRKD